MGLVKFVLIACCIFTGILLVDVILSSLMSHQMNLRDLYPVGAITLVLTVVVYRSRLRRW